MLVGRFPANPENPELYLERQGNTSLAIYNCRWRHGEEEVQKVRELGRRNVAPTTFVARKLRNSG